MACDQDPSISSADISKELSIPLSQYEKKRKRYMEKIADPV